MTKFVIHTGFNELIVAVADTREEAQAWIKENPGKDLEGSDFHIHEVVSCTEPYRYICD